MGLRWTDNEQHPADVRAFERLQRARARAGLTRAHVAHELGVTERTVYAWERQSPPRKPRVQDALAELYSTSVAALFHDEEE